MSAAQVSVSGLPSASSGVRSSPGASAAERDGTSFRDTLDSASRSNDASEPRDGRERVGHARGRKDNGGDDRGEESGTRDDQSGDRAPSHHRGDAGGATGLSAMLAALGTASEAPAGDGAEFATLQRSVSVDPAQSGVGEADAGPWLPGQVGEAGETVDAERLLMLLKSGATSGAADAGGDAVNIKASVIGQETHLALEQTPAEALATLAAARDAAESATATKASSSGDAKAAGLGAALAQAANGAAKAQSQNGAGTMEEAGQKADAGAAPRVGSIAENWTAGDGTALKDQGLSGESGRQSEGRGASGGQQQGTGSFMATFAAAGAPQAAGAVPDLADAGIYEPVSDQIAAEVRAELKADGLGEGSSDGVVKVLSIELKPANLGSVTVRLALKDNAITVHIEAQRRDTLAVIERERDALMNALSSAGYAVDTITAAPQSDVNRAQATLSAQGNGSSPSSQGQAGQGQSFSGSSGGSSQAGAGHSGHRHPSDNKDVNSGGLRKDADGLYV